MDTTTIAVDLAKHVFEVAEANRAGRVTGRRRLTRAQFERFLQQQPPAHVVMEACGTAHFWGRTAISLRVGMFTPDDFVEESPLSLNALSA
jgi:hypothetical protein